jgi:hypothetical protein
MNTHGKNDNNKPSDDDSNDWKGKFSELVNTCQSELKKTTKIGMKMISASQSNTQLHDTYETMGRWLLEQVEAGKISVEDEEIASMISKVKELEVQLKDYEREVQDIKKGE